MGEAKDDTSLRKQRIRERYRGVAEENLDCIPAIPQEDFYRSESKKRVAVYARVSTDDPNQTSSYRSMHPVSVNFRIQSMSNSL